MSFETSFYIFQLCMDNKERKVVPWFGGNYLINKQGDIFSNHVWKKLNPSLDPWGYLFIRLWWRKIWYKSFRISRLVAWIYHWLDINNRNLYVCHKDDNPLNNNADNLFIWSPQANVADMMKKWRANFYWWGKQWSNIWTAKLNESIVATIKKRLINRESIYTIAKDNWVSASTISLIKKWVFWKHVKVDGGDKIKPQKNVNIKKMIEYFDKWFNAIEISRVMNHSHQRICKLLKKHIDWYHPKWTHK